MKRIALLLLALCPAASAQSISYNGFNFASGQPVTTLREMAANGTNDRAVAVNLPEPGFPAWSRDGRKLALSSPEPGRPNKLSRDLFVVDGATGAVTKISRFEDYADGSTFRKYLPTAHAFSPDGRRLAATVYLNTSVVNSGITTTPQIYLFDTTGAEPPVLLQAANISDGMNIEGFGCDWSSTNLIAWPGSCGSPHYYGSYYMGLANGTAIYVMTPNAVSPQVGQLTFPVIRSEGSSPIVKHAEMDYAPSFSPDGSKVAYVRTVRSVAADYTNLPFQCSIRVVNIDRSGDHQILSLAAGMWVSQLAWSPDGSQLLFDMGPETVINNIRYPQAVAQSVELHTLNMTTLVPSRVRAASAVWPAWRPATTTTPVTALPQLNIRAVPATTSLEFTWPAGAGTFQLQSTPNLSGTWSNVTATPVVAGGVNKVTLGRSGPKMFFRLRGQ